MHVLTKSETSAVEKKETMAGSPVRDRASEEGANLLSRSKRGKVLSESLQKAVFAHDHWSQSHGKLDSREGH
jgi:hypothetical protein